MRLIEGESILIPSDTKRISVTLTTHRVYTESHCCPRQDRVVMSAVENEGFAG